MEYLSAYGLMIRQTSNGHADMAWISGYDERMKVPTARDDLVATLEETLRLQQRLVTDARDAEVPVTELVAQVSVLERLDDQRDQLISQLRRAASAGIRAERPGPPIREVVLDALADFRWPQNAGFLEEYLWVKRQLQLDSRAFAPLRRDERRAWQRSPGARGAYVAPALNPDGSANPRWITSSGWDLERRIVASEQTERLFDLMKIYTLVGRPGTAEADNARPRDPADALLENYAKQLLDTEPLPATAATNEIGPWRARIRTQVGDLIGEIRRNDEPRRKQIARQLADLPERDRIWGQHPLPQPRKPTKTRAR
jgi:hypothetical protein